MAFGVKSGPEFLAHKVRGEILNNADNAKFVIMSTDWKNCYNEIIRKKAFEILKEKRLDIPLRTLMYYLDSPDITFWHKDNNPLILPLGNGIGQGDPTSLAIVAYLQDILIGSFPKDNDIESFFYVDDGTHIGDFEDVKNLIDHLRSDKFVETGFILGGTTMYFPNWTSLSEAEKVEILSTVPRGVKIVKGAKENARENGILRSLVSLLVLTSTSRNILILILMINSKFG